MKFKGKCRGRVFSLGDQFYDLPYVTIVDGAIIDGAHISAHFAVHMELSLGKAEVTGIVHPSAFIMANSVVSMKESDPWRTITGKHEATEEVAQV